MLPLQFNERQQKAFEGEGERKIESLSPSADDVNAVNCQRVEEVFFVKICLENLA